jgi:Tfp pilus assembly protein PilN
MNNPEEIKIQEINKEETKSQDQNVSEKEPVLEKSVLIKEKKPHTTTILEEESVNLIPVMSREEIKQEEKKTKMNKGSLISLLFLFAVSIVIVGFNIISRIQLNSQEKKLIEYENELASYNQIIIDNNQILERIALYEDIQRGRYSTTKVVDYIQNILTKTAGSSFSTFGFAGTTGINFRGECRDLEELAKLWYFLANDPKLEKVELKSMSKGSSSVSFTFEANIILDEFVSLTGN